MFCGEIDPFINRTKNLSVFAVKRLLLRQSALSDSFYLGHNIMSHCHM